MEILRLSDISKILGIDIEQFLNSYTSFVNGYNQSLIDYYLSETEYPKTSFDKLDALLDTSVVIYQNLPICRDSLQSYYTWEVFDAIEDVISSINIINNYSRWLRSAFVKGRFKEGVEIDFILRQNQTLEEISSDIGFLDREEGFLDLTLRNHISERDYDLNGGLTFRFNYQDDQTIYLSTVVDNLVGDNVLGKDIAKKITFKNDDLLYLSPKNTFLQTCAILTSLVKNGNPEFPEQGFDKAAISNKNILNNMIPTFVRQLYATVSRDDTVKAFKVKDIRYEGDALQIELEYKSHLSDEVNQVVNGN